jgi:uncharacterized protein YabE (DUF348 family)
MVGTAVVILVGVGVGRMVVGDVIVSSEHDGAVNVGKGLVEAKQPP